MLLGSYIVKHFRLFPWTMLVPGKVTAITEGGVMKEAGKRGRPLTSAFSCWDGCDTSLVSVEATGLV